VRELPNTPSIVGYVVAVVVSVLSIAIPFTGYVLFSVVSSDYQAADAAAAVALYGSFSVMIGATVATPLACVAVPVIHLLCRELPAQWMHVAVTGAVSFALVLALLVALIGRDAGGPTLSALAGIVAAATMVGRASVIPLVRSRQRDFAWFERSNSQIRV